MECLLSVVTFVHPGGDASGTGLRVVRGNFCFVIEVTQSGSLWSFVVKTISRPFPFPVVKTWTNVARGFQDGQLSRDDETDGLLVSLYVVWSHNWLPG
jgi:hypothetical protein